MQDLIIVGGGAAALSGAMYALGKQLDVRLIAEDLIGKAGQQQLATQGGKEYMSSEDVVRGFASQVLAKEDCILNDSVTNVTKTSGVFQVETAHHGTFESIAVIIATGVTPIELRVPGATHLVGYGLGYSATTHAHLVVGKTVAVIGSTDRALRGVNEVARTASQIYLIAPDTTRLMTPLGIVLQYRYNVEVLKGFTVTEVIGQSSIEAIVVEHEGQSRRLSVDAAFVDLGLHPNSSMVRHVVQMDLEGFIRVDANNATSLAGLFAAGDVTTNRVEQVLIAIGEGARAAVSAYDYILARPSARGRE